MVEKSKNLGSFRTIRKILTIWKNLRDGFANALDVDYDRKIEIYTQLTEATTMFDLVYWLQILFSAGIATLGLVLDSSAVIIGAMLISPLMAPILSEGLALATGDLTLGVRAAVNLFCSVFISIAFAVVLVSLLPFKDVTPEIVARTQPNTLDLVVALFSGAIGSIATCRRVKGVVTSIPGVAIAVALMPPLCVVGFGLGYAITADSKGWQIASGGFLLFLTNLVAITFMAMVVFILLRIDTYKVRAYIRDFRENDPEGSWWLLQINRIPSLKKAREVRSMTLRLSMVLIPLLIISIPLSNSLKQMRTEITRKQTDNATIQGIRKIFDDKYSVTTAGQKRSYLDEVKVDDTKGTLQVFMRIYTNDAYTAEEKNQFVKLLAADTHRDPSTISLQVLEIPTSQRAASQPPASATPIPLTVSQRTAGLIQEVNAELGDYKLPAHATLVDWDVTISRTRPSEFVMTYISARDIDPDGVEALTGLLQGRLGLPNATLSFVRIPDSAVNLLFNERTGALVLEDNEDVSRTAKEMKNHANLNLRIVLRNDEAKSELYENKKNSIIDFFVTQNGIDTNRIVFLDTSGREQEETAQVFVKR
ncbi:MAG: DUF389 domain-containing protein [Pyrinomonadaceae bacterium]